MGFDETWIFYPSLYGGQGSVESFQMAHLKDQALRFCQSNQFISLLKGVGDGLFQKNIDSLQEKIFRHRIMERGGNGNADSLNFVEKVGVMIERLGLASFSNFPGTGSMDIHYTHQFHLFYFSIFLCMELAKVTDTDDTHLKPFHLTADPPLRTLDELEEMLNLWRLKDFIFSHFLHRFL